MVATGIDWAFENPGLFYVKNNFTNFIKYGIIDLGPFIRNCVHYAIIFGTFINRVVQLTNASIFNIAKK